MFQLHMDSPEHQARLKQRIAKSAKAGDAAKLPDWYEPERWLDFWFESAEAGFLADWIRHWNRLSSDRGEASMGAKPISWLAARRYALEVRGDTAAEAEQFADIIQIMDGGYVEFMRPTEQDKLKAKTGRPTAAAPKTIKRQPGIRRPRTFGRPR